MKPSGKLDLNYSESFQTKTASFTIENHVFYISDKAEKILKLCKYLKQKFAKNDKMTTFKTYLQFYIENNLFIIVDGYPREVLCNN